jgi:hypothetical protein
MRGISSLDVMEFEQYGATRAARQGAPLLADIARSASDEAIELTSLHWIASLALAMTGKHRCLPSERSDGSK